MRCGGGEGLIVLVQLVGGLRGVRPLLCAARGRVLYEAE